MLKIVSISHKVRAKNKVAPFSRTRCKMTACIYKPNFVQITNHSWHSRLCWPAGGYCVYREMLDCPRGVFGDSYSFTDFREDQICRFKIITTLFFRRFGLKIPIRAHIWRFWWYWTSKLGAVLNRHPESHPASDFASCDILFGLDIVRRSGDMDF